MLIVYPTGKYVKNIEFRSINGLTAHHCIKPNRTTRFSLTQLPRDLLGWH